MWRDPIPSGDASIVQEITSGFLSLGIEFDSDKAYLGEIETEQLSELREQLRAVGFGTRVITTAFKDLACMSTSRLSENVYGIRRSSSAPCESIRFD